MEPKEEQWKLQRTSFFNIGKDGKPKRKHNKIHKPEVSGYSENTENIKPAGIA